MGLLYYDLDLLISNPFANIQDWFISQFHLSSISTFIILIGELDWNYIHPVGCLSLRVAYLGRITIVVEYN